MTFQKLMLLWSVLLCNTVHDTYAQSEKFLWAIQSASQKGNLANSGNAIAAHPDGSYTVMAGHFQNTIQVGVPASLTTVPSITKTSNGSDDIVIAKFDAEGKTLWAKSIGGTGKDQGLSIALDSLTGDIYVTGLFSGQVVFNATTTLNALNQDIFVAKFNSLGNLLWATKGGGNGPDFGNSIALDLLGNVYVTGKFNGTSATFGSLTVLGAGGDDIFIAKYSTLGILNWVYSAGSTNNDNSRSIAVDKNSNAVITGQYSGKTTFNALTVPVTLKQTTNGNHKDIFIAKYGAEGSIKWVAGAGSSSVEEVGYALALDPMGNAYLSGIFTGTTKFYSKLAPSSNTLSGATIDLTSGGGINKVDLFVAKYTADGTISWARSAGGNENDYANGIAVRSGNIFITGRFMQQITFNAGAPNAIVLSSNGNAAGGINTNSIFIAKFSNAGTFIDAKQAGGKFDDNALSIATNSLQQAFITGNFKTACTFNGHVTNSYNLTSSNVDLFVAGYGNQPVQVLPLPVTWLYFNAENTPHKEIILKWATATELNSSYFEVQKSEDGRQFGYIGQVAAAGESNITREYHFTDHAFTKNKVIYYRLKQIDQDGRYSYSKIITIKSPFNSITLDAYPNPFTETLTLNIGTLVTEPAIVSLSTSSGEQLFTQTLEGADITKQVQLHNLQYIKPGLYLLRLQQNDKVCLQKVIKQ